MKKAIVPRGNRKLKIMVIGCVLLAIGVIIRMNISTDGLNSDAYFDQALIAIENSDKDSAIAAIESFDDSDVGRVHRAIAKAGLAILNDDGYQAMTYLVPLDENGPGFDQRSVAVYYAYLSRANQQVGAFEVARSWLERSMEVDPTNPIVLRQAVLIDDMAEELDLAKLFIGEFRPRIARFCGDCHVTPPPASFPRSMWERKVNDMYQMRDQFGRLDLPLPPREEVVRWYEIQAPDHLNIDRIMDRKYEPVTKGLFQLQVPGVPANKKTATAFTDYVVLEPDEPPVMLVSNLRSGDILAYDMQQLDQAPRLLGTVKHAARVEVSDVDQDGINDLLVAQLGSFSPCDDRVGAVVLLRGQSDGTYQAETLLDNLGRVADVRVADVDHDGDKDLIVAEFGYRMIGSILLLKNESDATADLSGKRKSGSKLKFSVHTIDPRHGAIHVPIVDINGDGYPDFVALLSQEHESVVAFVNDGHGNFKAATLFNAPEPSWGSSGIRLADMDGDQDVDVLWTNGDTFDSSLLRPQQGVQWLENLGDLEFDYHPIINLFGAYAAEALDFDNDGDQDVAVVAAMWESIMRPDFLKDTESLVLLENDGRQNFQLRIIERGNLTRITLTVADFDQDGDSDLASGSCEFHRGSLQNPSTLPAFDIFANQTIK